MTRKVEYIRFPNGVRVSAEPDSRGYHRIRFTKPDGTAGEARRQSLEDAEQLAQELAGLIGRRLSGRAQLGDRPVSELVEVWLEQELGSATYRKTSRSTVRTSVLPLLGDLACGEWDQAATRRAVQALQARGLQDSTISNAVRLMSSIAALGRERGYLDPGAAPTKGAWRHKRSYVDLDDLPRPEDIDKLAAAAAETLGDPGRGTQVMCGAYSGLRIGEVLGLQVGDIDLTEGTIRVERQKCAASGALVPPKYNSVRTTVWPVWLDDAWKEVVLGRDADAPAFPAARGGHEGYSTFYNQRWRPAAAAAGWLEAGTLRWSFHDLRHYFCTWALAKDGLDLDVADVARFAGHKSTQVTWETYVQPRPDRVSRARDASRKAAR